MKKSLYITAAVLALGITAANVQNADASHFRGSANIDRPLNMQGSSDYVVGQDLTISSNVSMQGSGDIKVGGNMYVFAPVSLQGSGDIVVDGDLIVKNRIVMQGSGDIVVHGKIYVIDNQGSITQQGSGDLEGDLLNVAEYRPAGVKIVERPVVVREVPVVVEQPQTVVVKEVVHPVATRKVTQVYTKPVRQRVYTDGAAINVDQRYPGQQDVTIGGGAINVRQNPDGSQDVDVGGIHVRQ